MDYKNSLDVLRFPFFIFVYSYLRFTNPIMPDCPTFSWMTTENKDSSEFRIYYQVWHEDFTSRDMRYKVLSSTLVRIWLKGTKMQQQISVPKEYNPYSWKWEYEPAKFRGMFKIAKGG